MYLKVGGQGEIISSMVQLGSYSLQQSILNPFNN